MNTTQRIERAIKLVEQSSGTRVAAAIVENEAGRIVGLAALPPRHANGQHRANRMILSSPASTYTVDELVGLIEAWCRQYPAMRGF